MKNHTDFDESDQEWKIPSYHVLTEEDAKIFQDALDNPKPPTQRAIEDREIYRRLVINAD